MAEDENEEKAKKKGGKYLLDWEGEILPAYRIEKIERFERWDETELINKYGIVINRDLPLGASSILDKEFLYETQELRERKLKELKDKLKTNFEYITIL